MEAGNSCEVVSRVVPGPGPTVRGHGGRIWAQSEGCWAVGEEDKEWHSRAGPLRQGWLEGDACKTQGRTLLPAVGQSGWKAMRCGRGARDPWRGMMVEKNSGKGGSGLMEDLSRWASVDVTSAWTWFLYS